MCKASLALFYTFLSGDAPACASPWGALQNQTSSPEEYKELALWFFGFYQRASHCGSLFAKYVSRHAIGQRGFPGHAIITD